MCIRDRLRPLGLPGPLKPAMLVDELYAGNVLHDGGGWRRPTIRFAVAKSVFPWSESVIGLACHLNSPEEEWQRMVAAMEDTDWGLFYWGDWPAAWQDTCIQPDSDDEICRIGGPDSDDNSDFLGTGYFLGEPSREGLRPTSWRGTVSVVMCKPVGLGGRTMACMGTFGQGSLEIRAKIQGEICEDDDVVSVFTGNAANINAAIVWHMVHNSLHSNFSSY
eukprot:TRINITY_DN29910_c0_g1_i1.p2 TRINITY_DN29910_c0_g1~~TRINITY_DN29910_c0_g1_i1.p2  ORF type:complete len:220 (-),score=33.19 TRINITY_DN29910_c0_g1_i1:390-1049(-)